MSNYDSVFQASLPADLLPIARAIARALDPDFGGYDSWTLSEDGLTIFTSTPCTAEFYAQAQYLMAHPEALHAAVCADYVARWADLVPPTLAECERFCTAIVLSA